MQRRTRILSILASALVALPSIAAVPEQAQARRAAERSASVLASKRLELGLDDQHSFTMRNHIGDELGQVHAHFQQSYNGLRVWGGQAITHTDANGRELPMTNALLRNINLNTMPSLDSREALAVAHAHLAPKGPYTEEPTIELVVYPQSVNVLSARARSKREADIDATDLERQVVRYQLAYHVHAVLLNGTEETRSQDYLINAHTGEIIETWNSLHTSAANGTGVSQWYGTVALNTNSTASGFEMRDMTRGTGGTYGNNITTNMNHGTSGNGTIYTDADNAWGDGNAYGSGTTTSTTGPTGQTAAVDAHRGLQATWDFFKNVFGRNGIDNTGKATFNRMHYSSNYDNAFWQDSCFCMTYGDGNPPSGSYGEADLDTAGHEMTHGVCATTANLTYSGESGGLNESNSDIFGTCVEFYVLGGGGTGTTVPDATGSGAVTANYTMFENSWGHPGQALRYMHKPSLDGSSPDAWSSTTGGLDVHYSSGPMNRCFYFMARGATTTGDTSTPLLPSGMAGIGNDKAARIWYRTLTTKLTASSNYAAARAGAIASAQELYGAGSAAEQAVWNAFHGINVGAAWSGSATAPAITSQPASVTVAAGATASFSVTATGTAPMTYQWRKNGTAITGATSAAYTTPATVSSDNGSTFSVVVSNSAGSATSNNAVLTVNSTPTAPAITSQPASRSVTVGATATFSVTATGTAPMTYQWRKNGTAITGATSASYTTPATVASDNGSTFSVVVSNSAGSATSTNATLTVTSVPPGTTFNEVEPNDTIAAANAVASTYTAIKGNHAATGNPDFFALTLAAGQKITINMTGPTGVDWDLALKNSAGTNLASSTGSTATESVSYTNAGASAVTVYANVYVYSGTSATPYNLALSYVTPPPSVTYNEVEANNSIAAANAVPDAATKVVGYIGSSTDNDYFKVNVGASRTLNVKMTGPTGTAYDYDLYFYNAAGTQLASGTGSTTTENVSWTNGATATTVYVAVKRYKGSSTTTPYNLTVTR
ncbi:MAG: M4 family metallopeptidase [Holophagaceae bacterium]|nr:M4 family metallopeptidase [Holophagaceae bacterium]